MGEKYVPACWLAMRMDLLSVKYTADESTVTHRLSRIQWVEASQRSWEDKTVNMVLYQNGSRLLTLRS